MRSTTAPRSPAFLLKRSGAHVKIALYSCTEYKYDGGLLDFIAECGNNYSTYVRIFYYDETTDILLRKYNANTNQYSVLIGAAESVVIQDGSGYTIVRYALLDGGIFDNDGEVNGQYADPVGIATIAPPVTNQQSNTPTSSQDGSLGQSLS